LVLLSFSLFIFFTFFLILHFGDMPRRILFSTKNKDPFKEAVLSFHSAQILIAEERQARRERARSQHVRDKETAISKWLAVQCQLNIGH